MNSQQKEELDRRFNALFEGVMLTEKEISGVLSSARWLKALGVEPTGPLVEVAAAELRLRKLIGGADLANVDLKKDLPRLLFDDAANLFLDGNVMDAEELGKRDPRWAPVSPLLDRPPADLLWAPSVQQALRTMRATRFRKASSYGRALDRIADVIAIRLEKRRGKPVESWWKRMRASGYLMLYRSLAEDFTNLARTVSREARTEDAVRRACEPPGSSAHAALYRQLAAYNRDRGKRGALMPKQRVALCFLDVYQEYLVADPRKITDDDLADAERLVAKLRATARRHERWARSLRT